MNITSKNCWYETKINITSALREDWKFPQAPNRFGVWNYKAADIFNQMWLEYMRTLGLPVISSILFYRDAWVTDIRAHIDIEPWDSVTPCVSGLNWIIGGKNSEMIWYETPKNLAPILLTPAGLPYQPWPVIGLTIQDKKYIMPESPTLTLVRTDVPHSIDVREESRWCFSVRLQSTTMSWDEVIKSMLARNLINER